MQAEWAIIMTFWTENASGISMGCTVTLNVHIESSCKNQNKQTKNSRHSYMCSINGSTLVVIRWHERLYLLWYGLGLGLLDLMGWDLNFLSNQSCPELAVAIHIGHFQNHSSLGTLLKQKTNRSEVPDQSKRMCNISQTDNDLKSCFFVNM